MGDVVAAAGAARARAQREVLSYFMSRNAVGADKAVPFTKHRELAQKCFERFRDLGVILPATNGGHCLDISAYDAWRQRQRGAIKWILLASLLILAIGIAAGLFVGRVSNTP